MPRKPPLVHPQTSVVLENIETVRQIQQVLDSGDFQKDLLSLLSGAAQRVRDWLPEFPELRAELVKSKLELRMELEDFWQNKIALVIVFKTLIEPDFYDSRDEPYVGYELANADSGSPFFEQLMKEASAGWSRHSENPSDYDVSVPVWRWIPISTYAHGIEFDVEGFYAEMERALREALSLKPVIDAALETQRPS